MGALIRNKDWTATAVGAPSTWPQSLRTAVQVMLSSRYAMWIGWSPELVFFYNDAYRPTLGVKHPWALGASTRQVWREIWPAIGPRIDHVMQNGLATWDEALLLFLERHGYPEETYHTFSYSPLFRDDGTVGGILCVVTEDTERVIGERRLRVLRELAAAMANTRTRAEVFAALDACLCTNAQDLPFALTYLANEDGSYARLMSACGIDRGHAAAPEHIDMSIVVDWPMETVLDEGTAVLIEDLAAKFADLPTGPWNHGPMQAMALPLAQQGQERPAGVFIAGLNPHRPFDVEYRGFLEVIAGQIAAGLANAGAYEEQKRRAEALAEINRAKTLFFSNASHEFRTPLTLMLSPVEEMLERATENDGEAVVQRHELALVHRNSLRLLKLVNSLLDFSRIESSRVQATFEPVDLAMYTAELASSFAYAMKKAGLQYSTDCPPLPEPVYVDCDMWEKIVLNLLSNAFKYTLQGEVSLSLRAIDRETLELTVSDTGVGIAEAHMGRLFERFYRIEGQSGRTHEGTGIGLALVQELVKLHGGTVHAESELGRGTRFSVRLKFGKNHLPQERINAVTTLPSTSIRAQAYVEEALRWIGDSGSANDLTTDLTTDKPAANTAQRARILLADDNADMREYVRRLLASRYEVEAVADGEAAFRAVLLQRPDLIVSDVMMPRLDGFGLVQALRADPRLADIPVILLSARAGEEARIEGLGTGADDYLAKPFSARELLARIASNLENARMRRQTMDALREEAERLDTLNRTGTALAAELDLERLAQIITDAAVKISRAKFGAFFYNSEKGRDDFLLYALSGAPVDPFGKFPRPRITPLFAPTFLRGQAVRSGDVQRDPRFGKNPAFGGMPPGHLPVVSYLAVPVASRSGEVIGALLLGHPEPNVFNERVEDLVQGMAAQAAVAIDNARLYANSRKAEQELRRLLHKYQRHQARLTESEARLRLAANAAALGIFEWRIAENRAFWENARMYEIFGMRFEDGIISNEEFFSSLIHPDDVEHYKNSVARAQAANGRLDFRYRIRRKNDGAERWLHVTGIFEHMSDGSGQRLIGTVADITEHKVAEEALKLADRRKDEFLAMLAHELRNPLAPILTTLKVLEYSTTRETINWARDIIARQTEQLTRLVDDLLDVSRVTQGKIRLRTDDVPLADIVERAVETSRPFISARQHRLEILLPEHPVYIRGDAVRLVQVLANLLNNAAKYTPEHGRIRVHAEYADEQALLAVKDNGIGITQQLLPHVFDLFSQGDGADQSQGLGIGLTLVRTLVTMHGGTVEAASEGRGKGSTFTIRLPATTQQMAHKRTAASQTVTGSARYRVLVIDDNEDAAEAVALLLRLWNHEVDVAYDGPSGIELAKAHRPDIILCDLGMPGMSGYDVVQTLRAWPEGQDITIAALTGYGQDDDKLRTTQAGFDIHLVKPIDPSVLQLFLNAQVDKKNREAYLLF